MPMLGHIAESGQVVAYDFRQGNVPPSKNNLRVLHNLRPRAKRAIFCSQLGSKAQFIQ